MEESFLITELEAETLILVVRDPNSGSKLHRFDDREGLRVMQGCRAGNPRFCEKQRLVFIGFVQEKEETLMEVAFGFKQVHGWDS